MADKKVWLDSIVSSRLYGKEELSVYGKKVNELKEIAEEIAPDGRLVVYLTTSSEKFKPIDKAVANIASMKKYYNENTIATNPEVAIELSKIIGLLNDANKIIAKRRKKAAARFTSRQRSEKKEPAKED